MYSVPAPLYDIHPNDFAHPNYMYQFNGCFDTGSGEPLYSQQSFNGMLASTFQNPNGVFYHQSPDGGLASAFQSNGFTTDRKLTPAFQYNQMPPLFTSTPSSSSQPSSLELTLTPSPGPSSFGHVPQLYPELEDSIPQPTAAPSARRPRTRCPNKRPSGTGFSQLMEKLSTEIRVALEAYYPECCGEVPEPPEDGKAKAKEDSSRQKHIFSNKHCENLPKYMQDQLPNFVCPAFVALHKKCKRACPGRYDSAERHCKNCPGFQEIASKHAVYPVEITKREHRAIKVYRDTENPSVETALLVTIPLNRLLEMMIKAGMPLEPKSDVSGAMKVTPAEPLEQFSSLEAEGTDEYGQDDTFYF